MTNLPSLSAREYKLLLDPAGFKQTSQRAANAWFDKTLRPILEPLASTGRFDKKTDRKVRFFDTANGLLNDHGYVLRERVETGGDESGEITLKLRTPDFFISGLTPMGASGEILQVKLEEDIAPLAIRTGSGSEKRVRFAKPPAVYSRYSQSTKIKVGSGAAPKTLGEVFDRFIDLRAGIGDPQSKLGAKLARGDGIDETVHTGPAISLGPTLSAAVTLTFWRFRKTEQRVAEVSFKYLLGDAPLEPAIGRLALSLFLRMQLGLPPDRQVMSKTALALPK